MKVVVLDGFTLNPGDLSWKQLEAICELKVYEKTKPEEILARAGDADGLLINKVELSSEIISKLPNLKYIGVLATGYNVVDVEAAKEHNIVVTNIPSYSSESVAQLAFAFILHFQWRVKEHSDEVFAGKWANSEHFCYHSFLPHELSNKTIGIVGFGNIGQALAKIALGLNMQVIYFNRSKKNIPSLGQAKQVDLDYLLEKSDIVSLNCPLTKETKNIINEKNLKMMKKSAYLINTGRGALVDELALAKALKNNEIAGFATDVLSTEPPKNDNPLLTAPNCIITPHIAWQTYEARSRLMNIAVDNLKSFQNAILKNTVF